MQALKDLLTADRLSLLAMFVTFVMGAGFVVAYLSGQIPGVHNLAGVGMGVR
jgi:hypothetical protein